MTKERTFGEHVEFLSSHLRAKYDLVAREGEGDSAGQVVLQNDTVSVKFFPGWPKDPYVEVYVAYAGPETLGGEKYFELWRYIDYTDSWSFFPIRYSGGRDTNVHKLNREYAYPGSPFLVLELVAFLGFFGQLILDPDRKHLQGFMAWKKERDREYNERVSRPASSSGDPESGSKD